MNCKTKNKNENEKDRAKKRDRKKNAAATEQKSIIAAVNGIWISLYIEYAISITYWI